MAKNTFSGQLKNILGTDINAIPALPQHQVNKIPQELLDRMFQEYQLQNYGDITILTINDERQHLIVQRTRVENHLAAHDPTLAAPSGPAAAERHPSTNEVSNGAPAFEAMYQEGRILVTKENGSGAMTFAQDGTPILDLRNKGSRFSAGELVYVSDIAPATTHGVCYAENN